MGKEPKISAMIIYYGLINCKFKYQLIDWRRTSLQFHRWRTRTEPNWIHEPNIYKPGTEHEPNLKKKILIIRTETNPYRERTRTEYDPKMSGSFRKQYSSRCMSATDSRRITATCHALCAVICIYSVREFVCHVLLHSLGVARVTRWTTSSFLFTRATYT